MDETEFKNMLESKITDGVTMLSRTSSINEDTFQSMMNAKIELNYSIELLQDGKAAFSEDEFYRILGKAVMNCKEKEKQ